jgi:hypothetical protein
MIARLRGLDRALLIVLALGLLEVVLSFVDLFFGPWGRLHWEELFNARGGVQFACGHLDRAWQLQYRTFCGGCTVEGIVAVPLYEWLGPTVFAWKLVPLGFRLGIIFTGAVIAWRMLPETSNQTRYLAVMGWMGLMMAAPGFYRDLGLMGWGNHAESTVFPFAALLCLVYGAGKGRGFHLLSGILAGLLVGFGGWFCHTSLHAAPAVALAALLRSRWCLAGMGLALPLGAMPWWTYHETRPGAVAFTQSWWGRFNLADPGDLWDWLLGEDARNGLWSTRDYGDPGILPSIWWVLLWAMAIAASIWTVRWFREQPERMRPKVGIVLFPLVGTVGLLGAYWIRHDLWENLPDPYASDTFNLRYRAPLIPMLSLLAAAALAWPGRSQRFQTISQWVLMGLVAFGLAQRFGTWQGFRQALPGLRVYAHDGWPDKTVPVGEPKKKLRRNQGRVQDIEAAVEFLQGHSDPLPDCRLDHVFELGRRVGLAASTPQGQGWEEWLSPAVEAVQGEDQEWFLGEGVAKGWVSQGEASVADAAGFLDELSQSRSGLDQTVGKALGRHSWRSVEDRRLAGEMLVLDPRVEAGLCEGRGIDAVADLTKKGVLPMPDSIAGGWASEQGESCTAQDVFWFGIGLGWAHYVGCGDKARDRLTEVGEHAALDEGMAQGCWRYRVQ